MQPRLDAGESDALLGVDASARRTKRDGHATLTSSVGNLANTIIGSGQSFRFVHSNMLMNVGHRDVDVSSGMFFR